MTACDSNSYLDYLNKLVEEHINTYHDSISKQPFYAKYLFCLKKLSQIIKPLNLKLVIEYRLLSTNFF